MTVLDWYKSVPSRTKTGVLILAFVLGLVASIPACAANFWQFEPLGKQHIGTTSITSGQVVATPFTVIGSNQIFFSTKPIENVELQRLKTPVVEINYGQIGGIFQNYSFGQISNLDTVSAIQLSVWELFNDSMPGSVLGNSGDFYVRGFNQVAPEANRILRNFSDLSGPYLTYYFEGKPILVGPVTPIDDLTTRNSLLLGLGLGALVGWLVIARKDPRT